MGQTNKVSSHVLCDLEVGGLEEEKYIELPQVFTQKSIPVKKENIPQQSDVSRWHYLQEVQIPRIEAEVILLIGTNDYKAIEPWKVINSRGEGPYAVKTALGWVINGPIRRGTKSANGEPLTHSVNRISVSNIEELLIQQYNADFPEQRYDDKTEMSHEDLQFLCSVKESTQLIDGHYCIGLPLKDKETKMPSNKSVAEQRLISLKRKLHKNPDFHSEYNRFMADLLERSYAGRVPEENLDRSDGKVWFIPHHGVRHPKKKKLRVVLTVLLLIKALNNQLLQGLDLTNTLLGVLLRFRKETVGMMADIKLMFYQVKVPDEDTDLLRFLWWPEGNLKSDPVEYRMRVHLFGATSSPSCASYALRRTAEDSQERTTPEAVETVLNNFYVDDCSKSVTSDENARQRPEDVMSQWRLSFEQVDEQQQSLTVIDPRAGSSN